MKKLLIIGTLCLALMFTVSTAFAGFEICGTLDVTSITVYESGAGDDPPPCDILVDLTIDTQFYPAVPMTAYGTELNLALLKAWNELLILDGCIWIDLIPLVIRVTSLTF